jgi:hypothetical protein
MPLTIFAPEWEVNVVPTCDKVWNAITTRGPQVRGVDDDPFRQPLRLEPRGLEQALTSRRRRCGNALPAAGLASLHSMLATALHET